MIRYWRKILTGSFVAVLVFFACSYLVFAQSEEPPEGSVISAYWSPAVSRWGDIITPFAQERRLDPDLIAAVIWKESLGQATAEGPTGAVGLMGLKPFEWRPAAEDLENPWTNLSWGARALAHVIRDGNGDVFYSLAAYNGGWDQIHIRVTRRYAREVLGDYTRAVAVRHGLPADGDWIAIIAVDGAAHPDTITVLGPQRPLARYTERPWLQADIPSVPEDTSPHTTVLSFVDERGVECQVNLWLIAGDGSLLEASGASSISPTLAMEMPADTTLRLPVGFTP